MKNKFILISVFFSILVFVFGYSCVCKSTEQGDVNSDEAEINILGIEMIYVAPWEFLSAILGMRTFFTYSTRSSPFGLPFLLFKDKIKLIC